MARSPEKRCAHSAQLVGFHIGVDGQRHRRIVAVPGRDDVRRVALVEHQRHRGVAQTVQLYSGQPRAGAQSLELIGIALRRSGSPSSRTATRPSSDHATPSARASRFWAVLSACSDSVTASGSGRSRQWRTQHGNLCNSARVCGKRFPADIAPE